MEFPLVSKFSVLFLTILKKGLIMAFNVLTIDFLSEDAPKNLLNPKEYRICDIKKSSIPLDLLNEVYSD